MSPIPGFKLPFSASSRFTDSRFCVEKEMYADGRRLPVEDDTFGGMIFSMYYYYSSARYVKKMLFVFLFFEFFRPPKKNASWIF